MIAARNLNKESSVSHITSGRPWPDGEDGPLTAARKYVERGVMVVPIKKRHKEPVRGWRSMRLGAEDLAQHFSDDEPSNIGGMMGRRSGELAAINLCTDEALQIAAKLLPSPTLTIGRASKHCGIWLYYAVNARTHRFVDPESGESIVEILAEDSKHQPANVVLPPSLHEETGERIEFDGATAEPQHVVAGSLYSAAARIAAASVLRTRWSEIEAFEVVGALVRAGWGVERIARLMLVVSGEDMTAQIDVAHKRHLAGEAVAGWHALEQRIGRPHVEAIVKWLDAAPKAAAGDFGGRFVHELVSDTPVSGLVMPQGYSVTTTTTLEVVPDDEDDAGRPSEIAKAPIIVSGKLSAVSSEREHLHLSWRKANGWASVITDRRTAFDAPKLVQLAERGFPVGSDNAKSLARYLRLFEATNEQALPSATITSQLGWQGEHGFLWGLTRLVDGERISADLVAATPADWTPGMFAFHVDDAGSRRVAEGFRSEGNLVEWMLIASRVREHPLAALALYTSLVPPLLEVLGIPNFALDYACTTSHGKTTLLRLAASVWGCPDERSMEGSVLHPWNGTRVGVERIATLSNSLPVILDDTKTVKKKDEVATTVYDLVHGQTRNRGAPVGLRASSAYRTVLISSGESPLTSFTQDGGTRTRVLEIMEPPFGAPSEQTEHLVAELNDGLCQHYGHMGPVFIEHLQKHRDEWPEWQDAYRGLRAKWATKLPKGEGSRLAAYVAAIEASSTMLHDLCGWSDWTPTATLEALAGIVERQAHVAAPEGRALESVYQWALAHEQEFHGRARMTGPVADQQEQAPSAGWAGWWDAGDDWEYIDFVPLRMQEILDEMKFDFDVIVQAWARTRAIKTDGRNLNYKRWKTGRVIRILRSAIPSATGDAHEQASDGC